MAANKNTVIHLHLHDPVEALERLNRVTGLSFSRWPQSLVDSDGGLESVSTQPSNPDASLAADDACCATDVRSRQRKTPL